MKRRPLAEVRVIRLPHVAAGAVRIEVECRGSVTGITHVPGPAIQMDTPMLTTVAAYAHEEKCGGCDTSEVHARGDQQTRDYVERMKAAMQAKQARRYAEARRN